MNLDLKKDDGEIVVHGKKSFKEKLKDFWSVKKNRVIVIVGVIIVILAALALGFYFLIFKKDTASQVELDTTKVEQPQLFASILDGTMVDKDSANRHPLGIMVENHVDSRPQSGLGAASIVYEAIAEGGITRFLAVYSPRGAEKVGPVRSARTYYVNWIKELNGYYAHVGGNYDALELIKKIGILDLDQFANPSAYWRDKSRNVSSEHTMYASTGKLYGIAADKKYTSENSFAPYKFKEDGLVAPSEPQLSQSYPVATSLSVNFGNANYNISYSYDKPNNQYLRNLAGKPHIDAATNQQLAAKNVIVQTVNRRATVTKINENGYIMDDVGTGNATVFQDGVKIEAKWQKDNANSRTKFFDKATNNEIQFNPGQTWIEIISPDLSFTSQ